MQCHENGLDPENTTYNCLEFDYEGSSGNVEEKAMQNVSEMYVC